MAPTIPHFSRHQRWFVGLSEEQIEDLMCSICRHIFDRPVVAFCGHTFCKVCIDGYLRASDRCPVCYMSLQDRPFHTCITLENLIHNFRMICDLGCGQQFFFRDRSLHLRTCDRFICDKCDERVGVIDTHNCVENINRRLAKRLVEISENRGLTTIKSIKQFLDPLFNDITPKEWNGLFRDFLTDCIANRFRGFHGTDRMNRTFELPNGKTFNVTKDLTVTHQPITFDKLVAYLGDKNREMARNGDPNAVIPNPNTPVIYSPRQPSQLEVFSSPRRSILFHLFDRFGQNKHTPGH